MDDARAIEVIREAVPDFVAVYRFGSTARGEERDDRDVDLAVLAPRGLDPVARFHLQEQLAITLRRDVDLVDLRRASTVMAMQVVSRGKPIATGDAVERCSEPANRPSTWQCMSYGSVGSVCLKKRVKPSRCSATHT